MENAASQPEPASSTLFPGWMRVISLSLAGLFALQGAYFLWGIPRPWLPLACLSWGLSAIFLRIGARNLQKVDLTFRKNQAAVGFMAFVALDLSSLVVGGQPFWVLSLVILAFFFGGGISMPTPQLAAYAALVWGALGLHQWASPSKEMGWSWLLAVAVTVFAMALSAFYRRLAEQIANLRMSGLLERAEMKRELASSQISLLRIAENSSDMIFRLRFHPERRFEYVNPAVANMLGYTPEEFYADPDFVKKILHPVDFAELSGRDSHRDDLSATSRYIAKDGRVVWISVRPIPVWENGRVVAVEGIARAVSEEKELEASLRAEIDERKNIERALIDIAEGVSAHTGEEFFRSLVVKVAKTLDASYVMIGIGTEAEGRISTLALARGGENVENVTYDLANSPCAEVLATGLCFYPDHVQRVFPADQLLREHDIVSFMGTPLRDSAGRILGVMVVLDTKPLIKRTLAVSVLKVFATRAAAEIERLSAADALRVSQARLRHALDAAGMGTWWWNLNTNAVAWDEMVHDLFGLEHGTFEGTYDHYMALIHPDDRAGVAAAIEKGVQSNDVMVNEHRISRYGKTAWLRGQGRIVFDVAGNPIGMFGICQDVTERKHFEAALHESRDQAETANRLKDAILANMSHEIRSPLTAILGFAELLVNQLRGTERERYAVIIQRGGYRLLNLLDGILDFAQIEAGRLVLNPIAHPVRETIERAAALVRAAAEAKGLPVEIEGGEALFTLCDPLREEQVFERILDNAVRFTERGRVRVVVERDVRVGAEVVVVSIGDTGIGMAPEFVPHAFDEFRQESEGHDRTHEGSGLGLAIAQKLVWKMGGSIAIRSQPGEGTQVRIALPAAPILTLPAAPPKRQAYSLLVVEDDADCADLLCDSLEPAFDVVRCACGEEAVELAAARPFDLILMDIHLRGGIDGVESLRRLRSLPVNARTPVVALTGYVMKGDPERFLAAGFDAYHAKPFDPFELRGYLLRMLAVLAPSPA